MTGRGGALSVTRTGAVWLISSDGTQATRPFLDLSDRLVPLLRAFDERGLWSLAFHPDFVDDRRLFVSYSAKRRSESPYTGETAYTWRLSEFRVPAQTPDRADPTSERVLIEIDWINRKHNGGGLAFGPDGYLYVGIGDGGGVHGVPDVYVAPPLSDDDFRHAVEIKGRPVPAARAVLSLRYLGAGSGPPAWEDSAAGRERG